MSEQENADCTLLSHHEQKELCTTRLPYRQGRKLTAVKVYTINNESKHILIFGVPSLNLRRETKELFMKFGKLIQFNITKHPSEEFTETYHAVYETIHSARTAKRMLDTKNYYGGNLHVCYAPEFETIEETKEKLMLRKTQVLGRLKNLLKETDVLKQNANKATENEILNSLVSNQNVDKNIEKIYMGSVNTITYGKRKIQDVNTNFKKNKHTRKPIDFEISNDNKIDLSKNETDLNQSKAIEVAKSQKTDELNNIEIIDFTSVQTEVISNINEALNYKNFGQEIIRQIPHKPVNKIKFNINKKF